MTYYISGIFCGLVFLVMLVWEMRELASKRKLKREVARVSILEEKLPTTAMVPEGNEEAIVKLSHVLNRLLMDNGYRGWQEHLDSLETYLKLCLPALSEDPALKIDEVRQLFDIHRNS